MNIPPYYTKYFQAAEISLEVRSEYPISEKTFHPKFKAFQISPNGKDRVTITHHFRSHKYRHPREDWTRVYHKNQWQIYRSEQEWIYHYSSMWPKDLVRSSTGVMNKDYSSIRIYPDNLKPEEYARGQFTALTLFNTDQMIFAKLLSDRKGLMVHANGFSINGNGILLAGISGSGKSTLSKMLKSHGHKILCDDRMFIRKINDRFKIFGNWCYGSHPHASPGKAPLQGFCFLRKGDKNRIVQLSRQKDIVPRLMQVVVKPLLDVHGWEKYLKILAQLKKSIPFYEIEFDLSGHICNKFERHFQQPPF